MSKNFDCLGEGQVVNVTTASQRVVLGASGTNAQRAKAAKDVMLDNRGSFDCYVKAGDDTVVATSACVRVPAKSIMIYGKSNASHLAYIGADATTLVVHAGEGG
jgi:hypothetical protein